MTLFCHGTLPFAAEKSFAGIPMRRKGNLLWKRSSQEEMGVILLDMVGLCVYVGERFSSINPCGQGKKMVYSFRLERESETGRRAEAAGL